jgi:hypothetical protein
VTSYGFGKLTADHSGKNVNIIFAWGTITGRCWPDLLCLELLEEVITIILPPGKKLPWERFFLGFKLEEMDFQNHYLTWCPRDTA